MQYKSISFLHMNHIASILLNKIHSLKHIAVQSIKFVNKILYKNITIKKTQLYSTDELNEIIEYNESREFGYALNFCQAPFTSLYFKTNGDVVACCKNSKDIYGNIKSNSLKVIWNSAIKDLLQKNITEYSLSNGCQFCKSQLTAKNYSGIHARIYDYPFPKNNYLLPIDITFEISNKCNLECIMCGGEFSSSIRKNKEKLPAIKNNYPLDFLTQLKPFLKNLKTARFQGGEPFLINEYIEIIEYINNNNNKCHIYIQTNGTVFNNRVNKIMCNKNIHLSVSMDSLEKENFEFIRKNSNYELFRENLTKFKEISNKNLYTLNINFCIMNNNYYEIPALFEFCSTNKYSLNIVPVEYPSILSLSNLPYNMLIDIKNDIIHKVSDENKNKFNTVYKSLINYIDNMIVKTTENDKLIQSYLEKSTTHIYKLISEYLNNYLGENSVAQIITHYKTKLIGKEDNKQKYILAKCIIHNRVLEEAEKSMEHYEYLFRIKLVDFFDFEIAQLTNYSIHQLKK